MSNQTLNLTEDVYHYLLKEESLGDYTLAYDLLRSGGLIAVDNVLWDGLVARPENQQADTVAIREFNTFVHQDTRIDSCLVPIGDGLKLIRK